MLPSIKGLQCPNWMQVMHPSLFHRKQWGPWFLTNLLSHDYNLVLHCYFWFPFKELKRSKFCRAKILFQTTVTWHYVKVLKHVEITTAKHFMAKFHVEIWSRTFLLPWSVPVATFHVSKFFSKLCSLSIFFKISQYSFLFWQ